MKKSIFILLFLFIALSLFGCSKESNNDTSTSQEQESGDNSLEGNTVGGELRVAYDANPPSLDPHMTTATATADISRNIFEQLVALDANFEVKPMLAESYDVNDEGDVYTFYLREGIKFHNGKEMTAEDVIASLNRWVELSAVGSANFSNASFEEVDAYTVELILDQPSSIALDALANPTQFSGIMPSEVIEAATEEGVTEFIGTGPYQLEEWVPDQRVHLTKYEDYESSDEESSGLAGKKEAYLDDIYFEFIEDKSTQVSGLQTGQFDVAVNISIDYAKQLESEPDINTANFEFGFVAAIFNKDEEDYNGFFTNQKARQAVNVALDQDDVHIPTYVSEEYYELDPSLVPKDHKWYSDAGKEFYNQNDLEKAKQLLEEAGYSGEEITILVTSTYDNHYNTALVMQERLESIGMNIKLDVYDWGTFLEQRADHSAWDIAITSFPFEADPTQYVFLSSKNEYAGKTNSQEIDQYLETIQTTFDEQEQYKYYQELEREFWEYLPILKMGNFKVIYAFNKDVEGIAYLNGPILWNTSLSN